MIQLEMIRSKELDDYQELVNSTLEEFQRLDYEIVDIENKAIADKSYDFYVCFITYKIGKTP